MPEKALRLCHARIFSQTFIYSIEAPPVCQPRHATPRIVCDRSELSVGLLRFLLRWKAYKIYVFRYLTANGLLLWRRSLMARGYVDAVEATALYIMRMMMMLFTTEIRLANIIFIKETLYIWLPATLGSARRPHAPKVRIMADASAPTARAPPWGAYISHGF